MTKFKCFHYQWKKASETNQEKHKVYEMKMIRRNNELINARDQKSLCCKRDCQIHQEIFY